MTSGRLGVRNLEAAALVREATALGVQLWTGEGRLRFRAPPGALTERLRERLGALRAEVMTQLVSGPPEVVEMSDRQVRIWLVDRRFSGSGGYHLGAAFRLVGPLDTARLAAAAQIVVDEQPLLRAVADDIDGRPVLVVLPTQAVSVPVVDVEGAGTEALQQVVAETIGQRIDLRDGPLVRLRVVRCGDDDHVVVLVVHHIVADDHAVRLISGQLLDRYVRHREGVGRVRAAVRRGTPPPDVNGERAARVALRREILGRVPAAPLPTPPVPESSSIWTARTRVIDLDSRHQAGWERRRRVLRVNSLSLVLALLGLAVAQAGGPISMLVGVPAFGRDGADQWREVGYFATTTVVHVEVRPEQTFAEYARAVAADVRHADEVRDVSYEELVGIRSQSAAGGHVLWAVTYVDEPARAVGPLTVRGIGVRADQARHDLRCAVVQSAETMRIELTYRPSQVDGAFAERVGGALRWLYTDVPAPESMVATILSGLSSRLSPVPAPDRVRSLEAVRARRRRVAGCAD